MNKIKNSEIKNFNEWCCGCDLENDFICGDHYNKVMMVICDKCFLDLTKRKAKINSLHNEIIDHKKASMLSTRVLIEGYKNRIDILEEEIEKIKYGRS